MQSCPKDAVNMSTGSMAQPDAFDPSFDGMPLPETFSNICGKKAPSALYPLLTTVDEMILVWTSSDASSRRPHLQPCPSDRVSEYPEHECRPISQESQKIELDWYLAMRQEFGRCRPYLSAKHISMWYNTVRKALRVSKLENSQVDHHCIGKEAQKADWVAWMFARKMWPREQLQDILASIHKEWSTNDVFEDVLPVNWPLSHSTMRKKIGEICRCFDEVLSSFNIIPGLSKLYARYRGIVSIASSEQFGDVHYHTVLEQHALEVFFFQTTSRAPHLPGSGTWKVDPLQSVLCTLEMRAKFRSLCGEMEDPSERGFSVQRALEERSRVTAEAESTLPSGDADDEDASFPESCLDDAMAQHKALNSMLKEAIDTTTVEAVTATHMIFNKILKQDLQKLESRIGSSLEATAKCLTQEQQEFERKIYEDFGERAQPSSRTRRSVWLLLQERLEATIKKRLDEVEAKLSQVHAILEGQNKGPASDMFSWISGTASQAPPPPSTPRE